jgi:hypothetical protein
VIAFWRGARQERASGVVLDGWAVSKSLDGVAASLFPVGTQIPQVKIISREEHTGALWRPYGGAVTNSYRGKKFLKA